MLPALPASACAQTNIYIRLDGFPPESPALAGAFYYAVESDGKMTFTIRRQSDNCEFIISSVAYRADDDSAVNGRDYNLRAGRTRDLHDPNHPAVGGAPYHQDIDIDIVDNADIGPAVKSATIAISEPRNAVLVEPSSARLYLIDDDGPSRFAFAETSYRQAENRTQVRIPVFRAGDASQAATVTYTVGPGAEPSATPGQDFEADSPATLTFAAGQRVALISFRLISDGVQEPDENIEVALTGAAVAEPATTTLTIVDTDEALPQPRSRFHHPRQGLDYPYNDFRLREVHVFTKSKSGYAVNEVEWALRREMKDGSCAWLGAKGFRKGPCDERKWLRMRAYDPGYFYYYRLNALKPTKGTGIASYMAFARATDEVGNKESLFRKGKNANRFTVKAKKKR